MFEMSMYAHNLQIPKKRGPLNHFNFNGQYLDGLSPGCKISPFTVYLPVYQGHKWKTSLCKGRTAEPAVEASWLALVAKDQF